MYLSCCSQIKQLREALAADPQYFPKLIKSKFLSNPHRLTLVSRIFSLHILFAPSLHIRSNSLPTLVIGDES
jgi:hypothetical protein